MAAMDGSPVLQVVSLPTGRFGVQAIGGNAVNAILGEFDTEAQAREWMMRQDERVQGDAGILKPGQGENLA
jgi:hypothetical protein